LITCRIKKCNFVEKIKASKVKCIRNGKDGKCEKKRLENLEKTDHGTHGGKANVKTILTL